MSSPLKTIAGYLIPYAIWRRLRERRIERARQERGVAPAPPLGEYSYENSVRYLVLRGLDEGQVRAGSIPESSLQFAWCLVERELEGTDPGRAPALLHIGNFVGISLVYLARHLQAHWSESVTIAIDPDIPHRGVDHPENEVIQLLQHYGLLANVLLVKGYSLEKSVQGDGVDYGTGELRTDAGAFAERPAPEGVLSLLGRLGLRGVDICCVDGNHEGPYLQRELREVLTLLRPGGVLIVDDATPTWIEILHVVSQLESTQWTELGTDGRVALFRKR